MFRVLFILTVTMVVLSHVPVSAQIINTLRGFEEQSIGWSGGVEGIVALADGNTDYFEVEFAASVQQMSEKHRWRALGRSMRRSAGTIDVAENRLAHLRHNYRFQSWIASVLFVQAQHDPFRRIESRILVGGGGRFDVIKGENWKGAVGATYMLESEELTDDDTGFTNDHRMSAFVSLYSMKSETVQVDLVGFYQPRIDKPSDARAFTTASLRVDIVGGLYFLTTYDLLHDSNPAAGVEKTDQTVRSGLGYNF